MKNGFLSLLGLAVRLELNRRELTQFYGPVDVEDSIRAILNTFKAKRGAQA